MSVVVDRAIIYAEKEGFRALELDVHRPATAADPRPVVLYVHGGGWRVSSRQRTPRETRAWTPGFFERIVEAGFVVVANDYRFSGEALYPAAVDDTTDALAWVREHAERVRRRSRRASSCGASQVAGSSPRPSASTRSRARSAGSCAGTR